MKKRPSYSRIYYLKKKLDQLEKRTNIKPEQFFKNINIFKKFRNITNFFTPTGILRSTILRRLNFIMKFFRSDIDQVFKRQYANVFKKEMANPSDIMNQYKVQEVHDMVSKYYDFWTEYHSLDIKNMHPDEIAKWKQQASHLGKMAWKDQPDVYKNGVLQKQPKKKRDIFELIAKLMGYFK